jgi:hypothetical protein
MFNNAIISLYADGKMELWMWIRPKRTGCRKATLFFLLLQNLERVQFLRDGCFKARLILDGFA